MTYEQALSDWEYLWAIDPADDMTGCYVDQDDLDVLLHSPTKKAAKDCLCSQIDYWFRVGPESSFKKRSSQAMLDEDPVIADIHRRHGEPQTM